MKRRNPSKKDGDYLQEISEVAAASVMVSYSRKDKIFVKLLCDALAVDGRSIWIDWADAPPSAEWLKEIHKGIESADTVAYILSPDSVTSEICSWEIDHAIKNGKRIIPIVCKEVDYRDVRKDISSLNWIFFKDTGENFQPALNLLLKELDRDLKHVRTHTRLLTRSIEWESHDFEKYLLLRGKDLNRAQKWLSASALGKEPKPTTLHLSFITASQAFHASMQKRKIVTLFFICIMIIGCIWPHWSGFFFSLVFAHFFVYFSSG